MIKKKKFLILVKAVVSISLLLYIIFNIDWNEAAKNFYKANYILLFTGFTLNILERVFLTHKWNILIRVRGIKISLFKLFLINSIGTFWGLFLPSSVGTDIIRGYYLVKNNSEKSISISSVFVDRILAMFSLLLLGVIAVIISGDLLSEYNLNIYIIFLFVSSIVIFYFFQKEETYNFIRLKLGKIRFKKLIDLFIKLHSSILEYKKYKKSVLSSFLFNLLVQVTRVFTYYIISIAFNISIPIIYFLIFVPIVMIVLMLPISIGGFGLSEGTFIAFFVLIGVSINDAVVISFTNTFINTVNTLLGGVVYLFYTQPEKNKLVLKDNHSFRG